MTDKQTDVRTDGQSQVATRPASAFGGAGKNFPKDLNLK